MLLATVCGAGANKTLVERERGGGGFFPWPFSLPVGKKREIKLRPKEEDVESHMKLDSEQTVCENV